MLIDHSISQAVRKGLVHIKRLLPPSIKTRIRVRGAHFIELHIVEHCNLNCAGCAHFSCLAEPSYIDLDSYRESLDVLDVAWKAGFDSLHLLGGEPLLHPELPNLIRVFRDKYPSIELQIITNGVLLGSMSDEFWRACKDCGVVISISRYPISVDYESLGELVRSQGVACELGDRIDFIHHVVDPDARQDPVTAYSKCTYGGLCVQIVGACLYLCPRAAYIRHFNQACDYSLETCGDDCLDLRFASPRQVRDFLKRPVPFCRYCDMDAEFRAPWRRSRRDASEWLAPE